MNKSFSASLFIIFLDSQQDNDLLLNQQEKWLKK